jgi:uncharacterized membrane protein YphA (DoxX/SURF4 family)
VFGLAVVLEGGHYLAEPNPTPAAWFLGFSAFVAGALLLLGFLTPIVGAIVAAEALGVAVSLFPICTQSLFDSKASMVFALTMLVALIALGPGRFSLDARVFGRREIIIPPISRS